MTAYSAASAVGGAERRMQGGRVNGIDALKQELAEASREVDELQRRTVERHAAQHCCTYITVTSASCDCGQGAARLSPRPPPALGARARRSLAPPHPYA